MSASTPIATVSHQIGQGKVVEEFSALEVNGMTIMDIPYAGQNLIKGVVLECA